MKETDLRIFMSKMSIEAKIGELVCLGGQFFNDDVITTGPKDNLGIDPWIIPYAGIGSNLSKETIKNINERRRKEGMSPILLCTDVVHGYKVAFPIPLSMASSFNMPLIKKSVSTFGREAYEDGVNISFAPMLDLSRDPRWGRVMESFGEDPFLGASYAKAFVEGLQGNLKEGNIGATVKHFMGYSLPEGGRDYENSLITEREMMDYYLPPYEAGIKAHSLMVMSGFNAVDMVPISMNKKLLTDLLRKKLHFNGVVISDYNAIHELVNHRVASSDKEAALLSFKAGIDVDLMSACYPNYLKELLMEGKISMKELDEHVFHVLSVKNKLGLFENPNRFKDVDMDSCSLKKDLKASYNQAIESIVLLKNENKILPLATSSEVLFIGSFINLSCLYSSWSIYSDKNLLSIKEVLRNNNHCHFYPTDNIYKNKMTGNELSMILEMAKKVEKIVFMVGERTEDSGEAKSKQNINLSENVVDLIKEVSKINQNIITVIFSGRPLVITNINDVSKAILYAFIPGTMGNLAIRDLLYGKANPSAKMPISLPYSVGQIPVYYNMLPSGRPKDNRIEENEYYSHYLDGPIKPLYCFGDGLSYSEFSYHNLSASQTTFKGKEKLTISIEIRNNSEIKGKEIVLLFVKDYLGSVSRPDFELKGFKKVTLNPKEKKKVSFILTERNLRMTDLNYKKSCEAGDFEIIIGKEHIKVTYE